MSLISKAKPCPFCTIKPETQLVSNDHFFAIADHKPACKGHTLIISKRHVENYFGLTNEENTPLHEIILEAKAYLDQKHQPKGYKLLMNCGKEAGQQVFHFHLHLLPYY